VTRTVRCAAALSEHPLVTHAVGECVGRLLEEGGTEPDLLVLGVTGPYIGAMEDIVGAVRRLLAPGVLIGSSAEGVLAGGREVEEHGALALFGLWCTDRSQTGHRAPVGDGVRPVRLSVTPGPSGPEIPELATLRGAEGTLVLLADVGAPTEHLVDRLREVAPELAVVGGSVSASRRPGGDRLVLDAALHPGGVVGALLAPDVATVALVSQGCRPIGQPFTVTASERNVVVELAGRPALERLMELVETLSPEDRALAASGLHLGRVVDDHRVDPGPGDFLVRHVLGADRERGAVAVGGDVELGATVQFQLRDAAAATADLAAVLRGRGGAEGALVFTCAGRGTRLFGVPDHDATLVSEVLGGVAVAGAACAGEIGPIGGRSFVHSLSTTVLLFG